MSPDAASATSLEGTLSTSGKTGAKRWSSDLVGKHQGVMIQGGVREYTFGSFALPLVKVERRWLVQEIRDWLGLSEV